MAETRGRESEEEEELLDFGPERTGASWRECEEALKGLAPEKPLRATPASSILSPLRTAAPS